MAQPSIAPRTPTACAGCRGQYPGRVHIDFRSAIEGPLVDESNPRGPRIDWVVLCENCIRSAYELLPAVAERREASETKLQRVERELEQTQAYTSTLEEAIALRAHVRPTVTPTPKPAPASEGDIRPKRRTRYEAKS